MSLKTFARILIVAFLFAPQSIWAKSQDEWLAQGKTVYKAYCSHCHGVSGAGDGYNSEFLDKDPAELSDTVFLAKRSNDRLYRAIKHGGLDVKKSFLMPSFGKTLSDEEIWSLVIWIRHNAADDSHPVEAPAHADSKRPVGIAVEPADIEFFLRWFEAQGKKMEWRQLGEKLFWSKKSCLACHKIGEEGGQVGPDLSRASLNYRPEWMYAWIKNPQKFQPHTKMPNVGLDDKQAWAIVSYLSNLDIEVEGISDEWSSFLSLEGDAERGKKLFFDAEGKANCSKCHAVKGVGGSVGPDLSYTGSSRTPLFLLESILDPKAVITAGYYSLMVLTKDRKFITGIRKNEDASGIELVDKDGNLVYISRDQIKKFKKQKISMMPGNFKDILSPQEIADCLAFLKTLTAKNVTFTR
ncbi:MAG: c-type cytochrome [Candidatus Nitrohelix vancouverensis]|uniref:C-type cytochrome n=1 Tax=Candidatus Nitrohelix vancouverensis TaxID=2705534 RepID=A0A7T0G4C1_9BACT|nr:MAG: c-type cytochrome [Candidatus Nitrohelix vancouverensis]